MTTGNYLEQNNKHKSAITFNSMVFTIFHVHRLTLSMLASITIITIIIQNVDSRNFCLCQVNKIKVAKPQKIRLPLSRGYLHCKLGTILIRHHGATYAWLCCSCQYTHLVLAYPVFLGHPCVLICMNCLLVLLLNWFMLNRCSNSDYRSSTVTTHCVCWW